MPEEFRDASCWWQWSSSQGVPARLGEAPPDALRLHLWFWLDRAVPDEDLRRWANTRKAEGLPVDAALFNPVQPHYTARPLFDGLSDPLPRRSGFREGLVDEVALVLPEPAPTPAYNGHGGGGCDGAGLDHHLGRIGPDGYQQPIMAAVAAFFAARDPDADAEPLKAEIRARIEATIDPARASDRARYTSDRWLDDKVRWVREHERAKPAPPVAEAATPPAGSPEAAEAALEAALDRFHALIAERAAQIEAAERGGGKDAPPPPVLGVKAAAGLGKTDKELDRLAAGGPGEGNVVYFVPEHRLSGELAVRLVAKAGPGGARGRVIRGRGQEHPDGEPMCAKADVAETVARLGAGVHETLCARTVKRKLPNGVTEAIEERCEFYQNCPYIRQFEDTGPAVRFMPHAYGFMPMPRGMPKPDLVVIDERIWPASLRGMNSRTVVPLDRLRRVTPVPVKRGRRAGSVDDAKTADLEAITAKAYRAFDAARRRGRQPTIPELRAAGLSAADCRAAAGIWYGLVEELGITPGMPAPVQRARLEVVIANEAWRHARFWRLLAEEIGLEREDLHSIELIK